jgi:hypothetical protein
MLKDAGSVDYMPKHAWEMPSGTRFKTLVTAPAGYLAMAVGFT